MPGLWIFLGGQIINTMIRAKSLTFILILALLSLSFVTVSYAQQTLPTITTACEDKNGELHSMDDGFSLFKNCSKRSRRVVLIGAPGPKGDKGDQGIQGSKGEKGDPGDPGFTPDKIIDVCFHVDTVALTVMKGGTCFPHVHWRIGVQCVQGKPCQPDNPNDPFFTPLQ